MARVTFAPGISSSIASIVDVIDEVLFAATLRSFSTTQVIFGVGSSVYTITGTGLTVGSLGGETLLNGGTISSMAKSTAGVAQLTITSLNLSALAVSNAYLAEENNTNLGAVEALFLPLGWTYIGKDNVDVLPESAVSDGVPLHLSGNDTFFLAGGNDIVFLAAGADFGYGGDGNDAINGGTGGDRLFGQNGDDVLSGGADNDRVYGGKNKDTLSGGTGHDLVYGDTWDDSLSGDDGNDQVFGGTGNDTLSGGVGKDRLFGDTGADFLYGGDGNDTIDGGDGGDIMEGGLGADTFLFSSGAGFAGPDSIFGFNRRIDKVIAADFLSVSAFDGSIIEIQGTGYMVLIQGVNVNAMLADQSWLTIV